MPFNTETPKASSIVWSAVGRGIITAVLTILILGLVAAAILHVSSLSEGFLPWIVTATLFLGSLAGGWTAASRTGCKGLVHGLAVGVGVFVVLWMLAACTTAGSLSFAGLIGELLVSAAGGAVGGILGVGDR